MQVYKQEILDSKKKEHQPYYFSNEYNEESKDFVFMYKGGYWEDRNKKNFKLQNIFDTTEYEKEMEKREMEKKEKMNEEKKDK